MSKILFSIYVWIVVALITITLTPVLSLLWVLTVLFDKKLLVVNTFSNFWGSLFTWVVPGWKVDIIGKEKLNKNAKILVANHQSQEDIILFYRLGIPFRWVSKAEVFKIPFYGWMMQLRGDIKLQRSSKTSIKKMMFDAAKVLQKDCVIAIFPEGTRSKTGKLGNFKDGAFRLAQEIKVPIVPIVIQGTGQNLVYPNGLLRGKHHTTIKVLDEIPYESFKDMETKNLTNKVRNMIERELNLLKEINKDYD